MCVEGAPPPLSLRFLRRSHWVAPAGLALVILLSKLPQFGDYRCLLHKEI